VLGLLATTHVYAVSGKREVGKNKKNTVFVPKIFIFYEFHCRTGFDIVINAISRRRKSFC